MQPKYFQHTAVALPWLLGCFGSTFRPLIKNLSCLDKADKLTFLLEHWRPFTPLRLLLSLLIDIYSINCTILENKLVYVYFVTFV